MKSKILLIGANGFLGQYILKLCPNYLNLIAADITFDNIPPEFNPTLIDITNKDSVNSVIERVKPDVTILLAAMTNVDACEDNPDIAKKINTIGPINIKNAIEKINGKLIFLSTDFVFDGSSGNYTEDMEPNPISVYGQSKYEAEKELKKSSIPVLICRTSVIYGWPIGNVHSNYFSWIYDKLSKNQDLNIVKDQITNPTLVNDLAEFLLKSLDFSKSDIIHTTGPESIDRYDFVKKVIDVFNLNPSLLHKIDFFPQKAKRPPNSSLNTKKLQLLNRVTFHSLTDGLLFLKNNI